MGNTNKTLFIFLIIILVVGGAFGGFYFVKKYYSLRLVDTPVREVAVVPGRVHDYEGKIPESFPKNIVVEQDVTVIDSYTKENPDSIEATYRYVSKLSKANEVYKLYHTNMIKNGYANTSGEVGGDYSYGVFEKPTVKILVNSSFIKDQDINITEITVITKII